MKRGEWPVPGKPDCFLQLLHDLVFAKLPDEHLISAEESGHGGKCRGEGMLKSRRTLKMKIEVEEMRCWQAILHCVFGGKDGREAGAKLSSGLRHSTGRAQMHLRGSEVMGRWSLMKLNTLGTEIGVCAIKASEIIVPGLNTSMQF